MLIESWHTGVNYDRCQCDCCGTEFINRYQNQYCQYCIEDARQDAFHPLHDNVLHPHFDANDSEIERDRFFASLADSYDGLWEDETDRVNWAQEGF